MLLGAAGFVRADAKTLATIRDLVAAHHFSQPARDSFNPRSLDQVNTALSALDPYSRRLEPPVESKSSDSSNRKPDFGIDLLPNQGKIHVIPRKSGALYRAGFRDQHDLITLDGIAVSGMTVNDIGVLLEQAAAAGTVSLGIRKHTRAEIQLVRLAPALTPRLAVELIDATQPYIRIHEFVAHDTRRLLAESIRLLCLSSDTVILDLRYASGGDLFEGLDSASLFLPAGQRLAAVVDGDGQREVYYAPDHRFISKQIMILTGPSTASVSEVFARTLQYYGAALLVGAKTYGKCLSQRIFTLPDGSRLRLSNRKILDPEGIYCEGQGLQPDIPVSENDLADTQGLIGRGQPYLLTRDSCAEPITMRNGR